MLSGRNTSIAIAVGLIVASWHANAGSIAYYDESAMPSAQTVARILATLDDGAPLPASHRPLASPHPKLTPASSQNRPIDATLAREKHINAMARAALADWQARRSGGANAVGARPRTGDRQVIRSSSPLAIGIHFAKGSPEVPLSAHAALDALAQGLRRSRLRGPLVIEGHAQATKNADDDMRLSKARAENVKRYLVHQRAMPSRLVRTVGMGSQRPLNHNDLQAPENQRVQLRVLG